MSAWQVALNVAPTANSLGGQAAADAQTRYAPEGTTSPQANARPMPMHQPPAGRIFPLRDL